MHSASDLLNSPSLNLSYDLKSSVYHQKNNQNYILQQTAEQFPVLENLSVFDVYLTKGNSVETHWHPNANELAYMIEGEAEFAVFNPNTKQLLRYRVKPPQTVYAPMGWFHWASSISDRTQLIAIFDHKSPEIALMSDVLRKVPPEVFQRIYGVNADQLAEVLKPINRSVIIGPPSQTDIRWRIGDQGNF
ncbi:cupin domain-containing protein [Bacillus sp. BRMEA1]|uniref:cupin domain-containing protein n=1 Tax=Neobacillus endophyticus TaxID=2738405 RepID=UPI0015650DDE|nr:cupin domain-containing protein [Neobacillus endophyticus]NRD77012.1 cupin domain-containing protein [Neobacillus endophyticus]